MKSCSAYQCSNHCGKVKEDGSKFKFHRFPQNNPQLLKKWIIGVKRKNFKPTKYSFLCSEHFTDDSYKPECPSQLKNTAVPTIFSFSQQFPTTVLQSTRKIHRLLKNNSSSDGKNIQMEISENVIADDENEISPKNETNKVSKVISNGTFSSSPTLEDIREAISTFASDRNWNQYHQPRNLLLALVGEVGELAELFQWRGEVEEGVPNWTAKEKEHLGEELSDVLNYLVRLSEKCHIDLPAAVFKKIAKNAKKNPVSQDRKNIQMKISKNTVGDDENESSKNEINNISKITRNWTFSSSPTLEDIREGISTFANDRGWNQCHQPRNLLLALVGEVGELAKLFQWRGENKEGVLDWTAKEKKHLGNELSDVLMYLVRLSEKCHIDLPAAVFKKIAKNAEKYPASQVYGSSKKYTEYKNTKLS